MSNTKYRYDNGEVVEQPRLERPDLHKWLSKTIEKRPFEELVIEYENHIASLRRYPAPNWPEELKEIDLVEGKNFRVQHQELFSEGWKNISEMEYDLPFGGKTRIVAIPTPKCQTETTDNRVKICEKIAEDVKNDAAQFDGKPFNGKTVAIYFGYQGAAIAALADLIKSMIEEKQQTP